MPEVFNNDDKYLRATLEKVNCEIREINRGNGKYSPVFVVTFKEVEKEQDKGSVIIMIYLCMLIGSIQSPC